MQRRATCQWASSSSPPPGYPELTGAGVKGPVSVAPLPGEEASSRRCFGERHRRDAPLLSSVTKYAADPWAFFDAGRVRAIPFRRTICAQTPTVQTTVQ